MCLSLLHLLFRYCPFFLKIKKRLWTSAACVTSSDLIASVCSFCSSVQTLQSGLLQCLDHSKPRLFSFEKSATCLASGHSLSPDRVNPSAYGTSTLWNAQFHELYSPFKAHTLAIKSWSRKANAQTKTTIDSFIVPIPFHKHSLIYGLAVRKLRGSNFARLKKYALPM